ncbi:hypothetical protein [uncultured Varibaculum sp.]|uniref:hypothetical protein n=1 Tax=uncultured Varibaculum sp. TaxID=413896 RepID=UPI00288C2783|nr:hypothetical protein [uncultured Varibaculum sp.]
MSKNKQADTQEIALMLKNLEAMRERTEQIANIVDSLRFYQRAILENAQSALITGETGDLVRHQLLPNLIETNARVLKELASGIEDGTDQLNMCFYYLSGEGEEDEE